MPRNAPETYLINLRQQAAKALTALQREIAKREKELGGLQREAERWRGALRGRSAGRSSPSGASRGGAKKRSRLDWNAVLTKLPSSFTAKQVAQKTGKPMEQVYAGVSRWVKDKKVRRGKDGYQKIMTGNPAQQKEPVGKSKNAAA